MHDLKITYRRGRYNMKYLFLDVKGTQNIIKALDDKELYSNS